MKQFMIWDYYQNVAPEYFRGSTERLRYLTKYVKPKGKVLNIGIGAGIFEEIAVRKGLDVFSLDPNEKAVASLNQRFGMDEKVKVGYSQDIPFPDEFFDAVVISEVIEHLSDETLKNTLKEVLRVLLIGGRIIGTVPAHEKLNEQIVVCPKCGERFHRWGHIESFDSELIRDLLLPYFNVEKILERPFPNWATINWKGKVQAFVSMLLRYFGIHGTNENIVFVATKSHNY